MNKSMINNVFQIIYYENQIFLMGNNDGQII